MTSTIQILVLLLAVVAAVAIIADRLKIPPSIPLVITGVMLALIYVLLALSVIVSGNAPMPASAAIANVGQDSRARAVGSHLM